MNSRIFLRKTLRAAALPRFAPLPLGKTAAHLRLEQQTNSHMWSQKVDDGIIGLRERKKHAFVAKATSNVFDAAISRLITSSTYIPLCTEDNFKSYKYIQIKSLNLIWITKTVSITAPTRRLSKTMTHCIYVYNSNRP